MKRKNNLKLITINNSQFNPSPISIQKVSILTCDSQNKTKRFVDCC